MTSGADRRAQEHAVAVAADGQAWLNQNAADGGVCDFCAHLLRGEVVSYVAEPMVATLSFLADDLGTGSIEIYQDANWAACPSCAAVVDAGDAVALADHVIANRDAERTGHIPPEIFDAVRGDFVDMYERLLATAARA